MRYQLRSYTIRPGRMQEFLELWRTSIVPARQRFGFEVVEAWVAEDGDEFVWVLGHEGDFEAAEQAYYDSPERAALDPDPKALLASSATPFVRAVSP